MGALDLMEHPYFTSFDWDAVVSRTLDVPYKPNLDKIGALYVKPDEGDASFEDTGARSTASSQSGFGDDKDNPKGQTKRWDADF
jgi:hypothetical protein